jgi:hypothetical protein
MSSNDGIKNYPARFLKVGISSEVSVKLVNSTDMPHGQRYCALSYRWGERGNPVRLLESLVTEFEQGIFVSILPQTLKDAIDVTRRLGIEYLWIDALCIIQDSDDWQKEAPKMADVYGNAYCTLSATHSTTSEDGLIVDRHTRRFMDVELVEPHWEDWPGEMPKNLACVDRHYWIRRIDNAPLNARGWVLQERFLSPRIIHFAKDQLFWECLCTRACEKFPNSFPREVTFNHFYTSFRPQKDDPDLQYKKDASIHGYTVWGNLAGLYQMTDLTKYSDKMMAISGLAKRAKTEIQDEYVAGLWWKRFANGLMWFYDYSARSPHFTGPSWSWMSCEGLLSYTYIPGELFSSLLQPIKYDLGCDESERYHRMSPARVWISGRLYPVRIASYRTHGGLRWVARFTDPRLQDVPYTATTIVDDHHGLLDQNLACYCMPVSEVGNRETIMRYCLLVQATGRERGEYKRIGYYMSKSEREILFMNHCPPESYWGPDVYTEDSQIILV